MEAKFEPEKAEIFQIAKLIFVFDGFFILFLRFLLAGLLIFLGIIFAQKFIIGLFLLFLSFEIFYRAKIGNFFPKKSLLNLPQDGNLADCLTLKLANQYLKASGLPDKLFQKLTQEPENLFFLKRIGIEKKNLEKIQLSNLSFGKALKKAAEIAKDRKSQFVEPQDLFCGFFLTEKTLQKLVFDLAVTEDDLKNIAFWVREKMSFEKKPLVNLEILASSPGIAQSWISGYTTETEKYTKDITRELIERKISPYLVGRGQELAQIEEILARDKKKNVILVGQPGVGKSTIVYSLAFRSYSGNINPALRYKRVLELLLGGLLTASNLGELESRLQAILAEIASAGDVIFYIPQIENIAGAPIGTEQVDLTGVLLGTLQGSKVQVIAATTPKGFSGYIEARPAFSAQFEEIVVEEPQADDAVKIAEQAVVRIEDSQKVNFTYGAVAAAVKLSNRYMQDRVLPGKAIDLLEQAAVRVVQAKKEFVTEDVITQLVSEKKGVPLEVAKGAEQERLLNLEEILHQRIVDQAEAIESISQSLRRARAFAREERRPIGAFLFLGPTGVGKTETARALAQSYFGGEEEIIRLDMSEYQGQDAIGRLIGTTYQKGQLTEQVRAKSFALILLDEIEKADKAVLQLFLQVFDEGRLTDSTGVTVDFSQTLIIATSNAGAELIRQALLAKKDLAEFREELIDFLFKTGVFTPEFLNRFDDVILFKPLGDFELKEIVKIQLKQVERNLAEQEISVEVSENLISWIGQKGFDKIFGARPIRRLIQDKIEGFLAEKILAGLVKRGDIIYLDIKGKDEIVLQKKGTRFG